jgi:hypothetical protein
MLRTSPVRRPLGIGHDYPIDAVVHVADNLKGSNLFIGAKRRIAGVRLFAADTDWSHGSGPEVSDPIMTLVMAMTGRKTVLSQLAGDWVGPYRANLPEQRPVQHFVSRSSI